MGSVGQIGNLGKAAVLTSNSTVVQFNCFRQFDYFTNWAN